MLKVWVEKVDITYGNLIQKIYILKPDGSISPIFIICFILVLMVNVPEYWSMENVIQLLGFVSVKLNVQSRSGELVSMVSLLTFIDTVISVMILKVAVMIL